MYLRTKKYLENYNKIAKLKKLSISVNVDKNTNVFQI